MKDILHQKYHELFEKYRQGNLNIELIQRGFVFQYDEDETSADVLFLGINPSYAENQGAIENFGYSYSRNVASSYFKAFEDISNELQKSDIGYNGIYTHIDLLVFRQTKQKLIDSLVRTKEGCKFLMEQLKIAKQRITHIRPKVVVVSNTKAREFLGKNQFVDQKGIAHGVWMGLEFQFDEELGTHRVTNLPELNNTYFIFSSMLSGQRSLDLGSRERMVWQIKRIIRSFEK